MLELHEVVMAQRRQPISLMVDDGRMACVTGPHRAERTALLRTVMGLQPVESGHISIDGELLTPLSAPYFRRQMAYVPGRLMPLPGQDTVSDVRHLLFSLRNSRRPAPQQGDDDRRRWADLSLQEQFLDLLTCAVHMQRHIVLIDEPPCVLSETDTAAVLSLLRSMTSGGASVVIVSSNYDIKVNSQTLLEL